MRFDEIQVVDHKKVEKRSTKKLSNQHCGTLVLDFFHPLLKWVSFCYQKVPKKLLSGVFYNMEGVQISEKFCGENPKIFSYYELYIGSNGFSENEMLGSGGFGKAFRAVLLSNEMMVAVKCLAEKGEHFKKSFMAKLVAVTHLLHRNLVKLRGGRRQVVKHRRRGAIADVEAQEKMVAT
ncbi:Receptor like protein kinase S.2 [Forsythia ovata]|uniref:Receptor like protein kinase S.2 n=1 Tax=Forsythia ovata TaxID=205694 RepID=A0ABD1TBV3_9LAMI